MEGAKPMSLARTSAFALPKYLPGYRWIVIFSFIHFFTFIQSSMKTVLFWVLGIALCFGVYNMSNDIADEEAPFWYEPEQYPMNCDMVDLAYLGLPEGAIYQGSVHNDLINSYYDVWVAPNGKIHNVFILGGSDLETCLPNIRHAHGK